MEMRLKRVDSMLLLISDYGGSLTSSSIKAYMGLSKDEFYRTLKYAKDEGLMRFCQISMTEEDIY